LSTEEQEHLRQRIEEFLQHSVAPPAKTSWWWVELWFEKRNVFKEAIWHILLFSGLLGSLEAAHQLLKRSSLPAEEIDILNKVHFYMYAVILVIFAVSFIIKLVLMQYLELFEREEKP
jgi:hypothetical protein